VVVCAFNSSVQEAEIGGYEFKAILSYTVRSCLKTKPNQTKPKTKNQAMCFLGCFRNESKQIFLGWFVHIVFRGRVITVDDARSLSKLFSIKFL
jgi:hypothetical protein